MKIMSGGQTGADRGALEAALDAGADYGGWVPKGRKAEDGHVPDVFDKLQEHPSPDYPPRTWSNVRDSDATVIFAPTPLSSGSRLTLRYCREQERPVLLLSATAAVTDPGTAVAELARWARLPRDGVLNVAGTRESRCPGLQEAVRTAVRRLLEQTNSQGNQGEEA